jgi:energy-coupling factor transporter transmembrane protein EcfT
MVETTTSNISEQPVRVAKARKTLLGHVPINSPLYQFHPVTRLLMFFFLGIIPLFIFIPYVNMILIVVNIALMIWGKVDIRRLKMYLPVIFTVAFFMFAVALLAPGKDPSYVPVTFGPITFYYQPIFFAFAAYWRLIAMLFGTIFYFSTNRERDMLVAFRTLRLPFIASYVIGLSIRSAGMFMEDFRTIREAEQARGLDTKAMRFSDQVKLYMMYLVPLFSIALRRADEISNALFSRGFTISGKVKGGGKRADYIRSHYEIHTLDIVVMVIMLVIFVIIAFLQLRYSMFAIENAPLNIYFKGILGITN